MVCNRCPFSLSALHWCSVKMAGSALAHHSCNSSTGIIDGFVYLGTGVMSLTYAVVLPQEAFDANGALTGPVTDPANWTGWPLSMIGISICGLLLATRVWNAKPKGKGGGH